MRNHGNRKIDAREKEENNLEYATGKAPTSKALDTASDHYLKMYGDTTAVPYGMLTELLEIARDQGLAHARADRAISTLTN